MNKQTLPTISVPASFVTRLASTGRMLVALANELQEHRDKVAVRKPKNVPKDQEWFWTEEWQAKEREVDEALARGEYQDFDNVEDLIKELHSHV